ncbi:MAG TPA: N-acetylglucosamine-specific PTS transporter subunit IIBC [Povalibacter sp.]|uniref:N-acetylglucosamine-specific PTS transporter subunit IIBC n=1 Tax=Povalibacter sp. TaxID=1962978 RepID=UPI002B8BA3C8|nr:N-acetylglucosamine-specific PTS transporter subunit IIBC [Povalibacter sp.]HMN47263.1 N-acetylglucosamine-specific PTS transporter subunit IIBC [Povalibacter sp.]
MKNFVAGLQKVGRALMLPIAVLPVAALLLRLGQPDLLNVPAIAAAGDAIFSNLGLLFAIGVAVGLARENHGAAGLASVVGYLVATQGAEVLIPVPASVGADLTGQAVALAEAAFRAKELSKLSVPVGIISGLIAGVLYNRYSDMRLPAYLAFFGGRRFVPIASGFAGLIVALCFGFGWPVLEHGMDVVSQAVLGSESIGLFAYGVLNRALIVTGLHHILNNIAWFLLGDYQGVTGDLKRFFAGDPTAGAFMSGFFPVMMFGLPAACLAMYRAARPERRKAVGGLLLSMALTSFLTGVTEPIEFSFMFLAPVLYAIHALLTGLAMVVMDLFSVRLGFGFSAGLFDYVLNFSRSTRPLLLLPIGLAYFALYYGLFRFVIVRFDLKTPGREPEDVATTVDAAVDAAPAHGWIRALGGAHNLTSVDACTTRLRLTIADQSAVNEAQLRQLGARGVVRPSANTLQVVVGPVADQLAGDIRAALNAGIATADARQIDVAALAAALGGRANIDEVRVSSTRLSLTLKQAASVTAEAIKAAGARAAVHVNERTWHVIVGPQAELAAQALRGEG